MIDLVTPYDDPPFEYGTGGYELWPINAMRDRGVALENIDWRHRLVTFANGVTLPIIRLFDEDGERVEDWEDACTYDFGNTTFGYGTARCDGDTVGLH